MASDSGVSLRTLFLAAVGAAVLLVGGFYLTNRLGSKTDPAPVAVTTRPLAPATGETSPPAPPPPRTYIELIRARHPDYPTTNPLPRAVDHRFAGHFVLTEPVLLDQTGRIWITREDAEETRTLLVPKIFPQAILTRERPAFVHWPATKSITDSPQLVCPTAAGRFELVTADGRKPLGKGNDYDWPRATASGRNIVVPTSTGLTVFVFPEDGGPPVEHASPPLADAGGHAPVQFVFDWRGITAWVPPTDAHSGSAGVARFVNDAWMVLSPEKGWPQGILHLIPLLDGSVLQLVGGAEHTVRLSVVALDPANIDEAAVARLIAFLAHDDSAEREKAFKQLAAFGPGAQPVIERLMQGEPPETKSRLRDLLRSRVEPLLGHMQVVGNKLRLVSRFPDGGALFHAERGIALPRGEEQPELVSPAWVSVRPGQLIKLIDPEMMRDFDPAKQTLTPWYDEWIISDSVRGPLRYLGNVLVPMLRAREIEDGFTRFAGIDRDGRFLFRRSDSDAPTLLLDPRLPDPTPRLPVWEIVIRAEEPEAGWNKDHWPAMKSGGAWALGERDWKAVKEDQGDKFLAAAEDIPPVVLRSPATRPTTASTLPSWAGENPIFVDADGTAYFDGKQSLKVLKPDGTTIEWELPGEAAGDSRPWLVKAAYGRLFLFNEPGRLLRLRVNGDSTGEPFTVEATFTHRIPNYEPTRMWADPFGRICFAFQETLTVAFPEGFVPPAVANLIPGEDQDQLVNE